MKRLYLALIAAVFLLTNTYAQSFVNGSFESAYPNPGSCNYLHDTGLSAYTNAADTGFGTADNIAYFGAENSFCNYGLAADGLSYIGLTSNTTKYDVIALKVNPAMQAGHAYTVTFKYKSSLSPAVVKMDLGYSANNYTTGTLIDTIPPPPASDTIWRNLSYPFTPTIACSWITLKAELTTFAGYSFIELDDFALLGGSSGVEELNKDKYTISPNPASGYVQVSGTAAIKNLSVNIADISGRVLISTICQPQNAVNKIDISNLAPGFYLLQINDGTEIVTKKLEVIK